MMRYARCQMLDVRCQMRWRGAIYTYALVPLKEQRHNNKDKHNTTLPP
jgi:hypothetical protein